MSMNEHTKHFQVMVDETGRPTVRILPGIDTGKELIFNKAELALELHHLLGTAVHVGRQIGKADVRAALRNELGIE